MNNTILLFPANTTFRDVQDPAELPGDNVQQTVDDSDGGGQLSTKSSLSLPKQNISPLSRWLPQDEASSDYFASRDEVSPVTPTSSEDIEDSLLGYAINRTPPLGVERRKKQNQVLGIHRHRSSLVYLDQIPAASRSNSYQDSNPSSKKSALDKNPSSRRRQKDLIPLVIPALHERSDNSSSPPQASSSPPTHHDSYLPKSRNTTRPGRQGPRPTSVRGSLQALPPLRPPPKSSKRQTYTPSTSTWPAEQDKLLAALPSMPKKFSCEQFIERMSSDDNLSYHSNQEKPSCRSCGSEQRRRRAASPGASISTARTLERENSTLRDHYRMFEKENSALRVEIAELQVSIAALRAALCFSVIRAE